MNRMPMLLAFGVLVGNVYGADLSLKDLRTSLNRNQAGWVAGESWVTQLPATERKNLLGANLPPNFSSHFISRAATRRDLPASLDWRNVNGTNFSSPILNQGYCGSCVAFATIGALETQTNITRNTPDSPWAFSPQYIFACGGGGCNSGWEPEDAVSFLESTGVPDEACFPYTEGSLGTDVSCSGACSNAASRSLKIIGSTTPTVGSTSTDDVKAALAKGPLITTLTVYTDFFFYQSGVYQHTSGKVEGGHAVTIVGYSDADRAWIVRNSWGPDWGNNGYIEVSWDDDSGVGQNTWSLEVPASAGYVTLGSLRDHTVLQGTYALDIQSTYPNTDSVSWALTKDGRFLAWGTRGESIDTTQYADGPYTLVASAHHDGTTDTSQPRIVYVLNGKLTGSVQFTNVTPNQSIAAQPFVMEMSTSSSPVPFSKVTFHAKNVDTGVQFNKFTVNVGSKMAMSWRQQVPAGNYNVWLEGSAGNQVVSSTPIPITVTD